MAASILASPGVERSLSSTSGTSLSVLTPSLNLVFDKKIINNAANFTISPFSNTKIVIVFPSEEWMVENAAECRSDIIGNSVKWKTEHWITNEVRS